MARYPNAHATGVRVKNNIFCIRQGGLTMR